MCNLQPISPIAIARSCIGVVDLKTVLLQGVVDLCVCWSLCICHPDVYDMTYWPLYRPQINIIIGAALCLEAGTTVTPQQVQWVVLKSKLFLTIWFWAVLCLTPEIWKQCCCYCPVVCRKAVTQLFTCSSGKIMDVKTHQTGPWKMHEYPPLPPAPTPPE